MLLEDYENSNKEQYDSIIEEYNQNAKRYQDLFGSALGQDIWADLQAKFLGGPSFIPGREMKDVCYFEGQKSVMAHIKQLLEYKYDGK